MPKITVSRNRGYYAKIRALKIFVEGEQVATINQGESITLDVPSHEFEIYGKMDWAKTNVLQVNRAKTGDHFTFTSWFTLNPFRNFGIPTMPIRIDQVLDSSDAQV